MFTIKMESVPGPANGAVNLKPETRFGSWYVPVGPEAELGPSPRGYNTGWYSVIEVDFPNREAAALALGWAMWRDDNNFDDAANGEAELCRLGY